MRLPTPSALLALVLSGTGALAAPVRIEVDCDQPKAPLSPHLYGLFFEDINFGADGGLYAELVQNRSFEYYSVGGDARLSRSYHPLYAWEKVVRGNASCDLQVGQDSPLNPNNTHYLRLTLAQPGVAGVLNSGFDGIPLDAGHRYDLSFHARSRDWSGDTRITATLELADGTVVGTTRVDGVGPSWRKFAGVITADRTADDARLVLTLSGKGTLDLDVISLFPQDTYAGRKNGLRKDLVQALVDLNPKFLRFPGGCIAHGSGLDNAYRWKDTVGDISERKPNWNRWGYHQTYGLGYYEYFLLCEDIGATPLPVVPVGVSCGFNKPYECVPLDQLQPWIDDALDLIEFANGPVTSKWGALRARMGHPEPFNLEFICLGNEEHDRPEMRERFPHFVKAVRDAHPGIKIIGTSGLSPDIPLYGLMKELGVYSTDEHYYESPLWYLGHQDRFDSFDRKGPKVFVGEYASGGNALFNAVAEAAYLTGIERNGDIVDMACYAPLFANVRHTQWPTDLIYFDHRAVVKTPNYYVQQLFAQNKGDAYLANTVSKQEAVALPTVSGSVGVGTWATAIEVEQLRVNGRAINPATLKAASGDFALNGVRYVQRDARIAPAISIGGETFSGSTVTYTLRARKTAGDEGFLVVFGGKDADDCYWWNIGGWGNTRHGIQKSDGAARTLLAETQGSIETGRWYDLKVELGPGRIKCSIDGKLVHDYAFPQHHISLSPTLDRRTGDVILKLVNPSSEAVATTIHLKGLARVGPVAQLTLLTGGGRDENSVQRPDAVKPVTSQIKVAPRFDYTLPPMSVQFIRVKTK